MHFKLDVPYREKDQAKQYGAKWNYKEKYWYYEGEELAEGLQRWYQDPEAQETASIMPAMDIAVKNEMGTDLYADYKTVSQINDMILRKFYDTKEFQFIMVKGEVTNYSGHKGGHYYFTLKDQDAQLHCVMWASTAQAMLKFTLEKGQMVAIVGDLDYYRAGGRTHLIVRRIVNIGDGAANLAFLQLKAKLRAEGLFDPEHKKSIPKHPKKVGIITSKDGQAIRDIYKVAHKRNPYVQLILYHVKVQGKDAVATIVKGIQYMDQLGLDSLIVGRGGGSDEELKAYNEEAIARAVFAARTPIVSAVGHEGHWTLIDDTADKRVATPSEAAEETIPDLMAEVRRLQLLQEKMLLNIQNALNERKVLLENRMAVMEKYNPERILKEQQKRLSLAENLLHQNMQRIFEEKKHRYDVLLANLNGLSPTAKLVKGFGYITLNDQPVTRIQDVEPGDQVKIKIHDGEMLTKVLEIS